MLDDIRGPQTSVSLSTKVIMLSGGLSVALVMSSISPVLPQIEDDLARSADDVFIIKMLIGAVGFAMMFGAPLSGLLADRIGVRKLLLWSGILFVLAGTAGLWVSDLDLLLASRLVAGIASASWATASMTLINRSFSGLEQAKWMGRHISVAILGNLLLHPVAGALGELGWRWPFLIHLFGLVIIVAALFVSPMAEPEASRADAPTQDGEKTSVFRWFPFRFAALAIVMGSVTYLPVVYLPFVARETGVDSPFLISTIGLADAALAAGMALVFARARKRFSSSGAFAWSFGCAALGLLIAGTATSFIQVVIGMGIFGLGLGWFVPNLMTSASAVVSFERQGRTVGLIKGAHYMAAPLGTILVEPVARTFGPSGALLSVSCLAALVLSIFLLDLMRGRGALAGVRAT